MAGLAEGAGQRHQLYLQGLPEAAGRLLQHLDGHAARGPLLGANDIRGNVCGQDHHGVGAGAWEEEGAAE
ncbi:hypothetical protein D3C79_900000 [compost metagenome]